MAKRTPLKAIRAKCLECSCGQVKEVKLCLVKNAPYMSIEAVTGLWWRKTPLNAFEIKNRELAYVFLA